MYNLCVLLFAGFNAMARAQVQGEPPSPILLTTAESGVLPVIPSATAFAGFETIEGALVYDGPVVAGVTGQYGDAIAQTNVPGTSFMATLPSSNFDPYTGSTITGSIVGTVPSDGMGVMMTVSFTGFPSETEFGPFVYHIHTLPITADGNCTTSLGHLDPTNRGEYYACDNTQPQTCQAGDLSGKHGNITASSLSVSYLEPYLSTDPTSDYYFGDKSIVIHSANVTRLTCANFVAVAAATATSILPAPSSTAPGTTYTGLATQAVMSGSLLGGAIVAVLAFLA